MSATEATRSSLPLTRARLPRWSGLLVGAVAVGVRPEKIGVGAPQDGSNVLRGTVFERAYIGV